MTSQHREALSGLIYSVCSSPGLTLLIGEAGTGKTTLIYTLLKLLKKQTSSVVAVCNNTTLTRVEFYDFLLAKLGVECNSSLKSRQLIALEESLRRNHANGQRSILIVDEAQRLSTELLEEVRLLLNLETTRVKLLEIIMVGQPELSGIFQLPELRQLKQRINYSCKLEPLSLEELKEYIRHRLSRAGLPKQTLFSEECIQVIYRYTQGIPRVVNTLCDNSLQTGFGLQSPRITIPIIEEAAADLQLTPYPNGGGLPSNGKKRAAVSVTTKSQALSLPSSPSPTDIPPKSRNTSFNRVPLEDYAGRQKSLGFLAELMGRLR